MHAALAITEGNPLGGRQDLPECGQPSHIILHMVLEAIHSEVVEHLISQGLELAGIVVVLPVLIELAPDDVLHSTKEVLNGPVQVMAVARQRKLLAVVSKANHLGGVVGVRQGAEVCGGLDGVVVKAEIILGTLCLLIPVLDDVVHVVLKLLPGGLLCIPLAAADLQEHKAATRHRKAASVEVEGFAARPGGWFRGGAVWC